MALPGREAASGGPARTVRTQLSKNGERNRLRGLLGRDVDMRQRFGKLTPPMPLAAAISRCFQHSWFGFVLVFAWKIGLFITTVQPVPANDSF